MKLNTLILAALFVIAISACQSKKEVDDHNHDNSVTPAVQTDTIRKSIPKEEHAQVGNANVMIKYHAPAVRGRTIWGGLVPLGEVWVTGAHSATSFEIDKAFFVGEQEIGAGKYALFTIPDKDKWTIILNKNWDQHLADEYDQNDDIIRFTVIPEQLADVQERLKYSIVPESEKKGTVAISWEKIKISLPFSIK
jgi:hypothetical protein